MDEKNEVWWLDYADSKDRATFTPSNNGKLAEILICYAGWYLIHNTILTSGTWNM